MDHPTWLSKRNSTHVVVCASRGKGHINPAMTLSAKLASLGLSITVVFPDQSSYSLVSLSDPSPIQGLDIALAKLPLREHEQYQEEESLGWTMDGVRTGIRSGYDLPSDFTPQQRALEQLLTEMKASPSPPACVIVDILLPWSEQLIAKLGFPRFVLYTAAATYLPLVLHAKSLYKQGILPVVSTTRVDSTSLLETMEVPGLPTIRWTDVPDGIKDSSHSLYDLHWGWIAHMMSSAGILFNTFYEFESPVFDALRGEFPETRAIADAILPVGPLFPSEYFSSQDEALSATKKSSLLRSSEEDRCQAWLDKQPAASVVYISFGSWALLSAKQAHELALGLESSRQRFLWVLPVKNKSSEALDETLPQGFLERTQGIGLVVPGWAPQHLILTHPSTGGFLTHCGWNSTLEAVTLAGIPLIGWPFLADQPPNCRYIVDGVRIGAEVHGDGEGFVGRDEVERAVREIMEGPEAEGMRRRVKELKQAAREAVAEGGSSHRNLQALVSKILSFSRG